jgi:hypothetical protein
MYTVAPLLGTVFNQGTNWGISAPKFSDFLKSFAKLAYTSNLFPVVSIPNTKGFWLNNGVTYEHVYFANSGRTTDRTMCIKRKKYNTSQRIVRTISEKNTKYTFIYQHSI